MKQTDFAMTQVEQMQQTHQLTLSKLSHEIRNPVALINSFLQLLAKQHPEVTSYEYWYEIMENMDYLKLLLEDLSSYNNADKLAKKPIYMDSYLEKLAASVRPMLDYLGIRLDCHFALPLPLLEVDTIKLRQLLLNLIRNAQEAIPSPSVIRISAGMEQDRFLLRVFDDGGGIPSEYLPTIFDPFVTHKAEGTGLGLAVAKSITEAHGGTIHLATGDWGTAFTIYLPFTQKDQALCHTAFAIRET